MLAQQIRWSQGLHPPTNSQPTRDASEAGSPPAATTVKDLLEFRCPKSGLTPLMAAVVKGHLSMTRQASPIRVLTHSHPGRFAVQHHRSHAARKSYNALHCTLLIVTSSACAMLYDGHLLACVSQCLKGITARQQDHTMKHMNKNRPRQGSNCREIMPHRYTALSQQQAPCPAHHALGTLHCFTS